MWKRIVGLSLIIIGSLGLLKAVTKNDKSDARIQEGAHNLALRQVAHKLYLMEDDSISRILPVSNINDSTFQIKIEKQLNYQALPFLVQQAVNDFNLNEDYIVAVKDCETESITLGFNSTAALSTDIPCGSRDHNLDCSILSVTFTKKEQKANFTYFIFLSILLLGIALLLYTLLTRSNKIIDNQVQELIEKEPQLNPTLISIGAFNFDPINQTISNAGGSKSLTFRENKLLKYLSDNINSVLKRDDIMANVWEEEGILVGRSLDVFISRLRKILKEDPRIQIKSVHGVGYRLIID